MQTTASSAIININLHIVRGATPVDKADTMQRQQWWPWWSRSRAMEGGKEKSAKTGSAYTYDINTKIGASARERV